MATSREIAEAFSSHRFRETYDALAPDVRWTSVGSGTTEGKDAVISVCEETLRELAGTSTEFARFVVADGGDTVAVDVVGRYVGSDGISAVASCDILEFRAGQISLITSYAVEVADPGA